MKNPYVHYDKYALNISSTVMCQSRFNLRFFQAKNVNIIQMWIFSGGLPPAFVESLCVSLRQRFLLWNHFPVLIWAHEQTDTFNIDSCWLFSFKTTTNLHRAKEHENASLAESIPFGWVTAIFAGGVIWCETRSLSIWWWSWRKVKLMLAADVFLSNREALWLKVSFKAPTAALHSIGFQQLLMEKGINTISLYKTLPFETVWNGFFYWCSNYLLKMKVKKVPGSFFPSTFLLTFVLKSCL